MRPKDDGARKGTDDETATGKVNRRTSLGQPSGRNDKKERGRDVLGLTWGPSVKFSALRVLIGANCCRP